MTTTSRLRVRSSASVALLIAASLMACEDAPADPRFASPQATIDTLFDSYGVRDVPQEEIRQRMRARGRFELIDADLYARCFADFRGEADEGLAGYVFGSLVAGKDQLRVTVTGDTATVFPTSDEGAPRPVTMQKDGSEWRIVLRQSVPTDIQERLAEVYQRSKEMERRRGTPQ